MHAAISGRGTQSRARLTPFLSKASVVCIASASTASPTTTPFSSATIKHMPGRVAGIPAICGHRNPKMIVNVAVSKRDILFLVKIVRLEIDLTDDWSQLKVRALECGLFDRRNQERQRLMMRKKW